MDKVEQSAPQENEVRNQGARSENYMARFLTQTVEALDTTKPFSLGSPEPLTITADKLKILDRYTLDYATDYWSQNDRKTMTHEQKLEEFASKWANAINKKYALPKVGEAVRLDDLEDRKKKREVLRKLGLDPQNMSANVIRKYHDENFTKGRDVNAFITRVRQSLSSEEMSAHLDDIEFIAGMFDRETAKDIRAVLELGLEQNVDAYAKRANAQGTIRSNEEKRRLQELAKYLKSGELVVQIDKVETEDSDADSGTGSSGRDRAIKVDVKADVPLKVDVTDEADKEAGREDVIDIEVDTNGKSTEDDDLEITEVDANIPTKEFPKDAKLYGQEGDNMRIVISEPVLVQINKVLNEMSWEDGEFKEKGAVFVGKKYKDENGRIWTDIVGAVPLSKTVSKWGSINFTPDSWVEAYDVIDNFLNVDKEGNRRPKDDQLELISWVHTHPKLWEGVLSAQDEQPALTFPNPWNFAYVYAAGLGKDTPVDVSQVDAGEIGKLFAFFSTGGTGTNFGTYNKHNGFYTRPKTDRDKAYGTGDQLPNGKAVDELIKELEVKIV